MKTVLRRALFASLVLAVLAVPRLPAQDFIAQDEDEPEWEGNDDISTEEEEEVFRSKVEVRAE